MSRVLSTEEFIARARKVHGNKYDYSKADYKNAHTKVTIICTEHGEFEQRPDVHMLSNQGCPKCGKISSIKTRTHSKEEFINKAKKLHNDRYDYSQVNYKNKHTKVKIICPIHGEFEQKPINHCRRRQGCPKCNTGCGPGFDRSSDQHPGFLYFLTCKLGNDYFCKIGTAYNTKQRFRLFPFEIVDSLIIPGIIGPLSIVEEQIKSKFDNDRYVPKVKFAGSKKECFRISTYREILKSIRVYVSFRLGNHICCRNILLD